MRTHATVLALLVASALAGCSRDVPDTFPTASAASLDAPEASAASVAVALEGDPPLPGEPTAGWEALERDAGADHGHHGHGGHHHAP